MKLDHTASSSDAVNRVISDSLPVQFLPSQVTDVAKDIAKNFPHTKRVGNYLLGKTLGEGSFAKVKEGLHTLTGEKVAIKVIDKKKAKEDAYVRKNLRREGKLLQMVRHRNVVQLFEIMETENSYYLVTELCQGGDLMDHICNKKKLEEREAKKYIRQIISAVDYLHRSGILHRDLKVENLLLDSNRDIKIIDFGLSNSVRVQHTKEGGSLIQEFCVTQCGSPAYAAPELLGNKKYGPKVDIWSIGVNMYAMLTGNLPFTVEPFNIKALHSKMLKGELNAIPEHLSRNCKDILKRFLTPDVDARISLQEAMEHPWITEGRNRPLEPSPFPNKLSSDDLNQNLIKHMAHNMEFRLSDVIRLVTNNIPNSCTATYHLLQKKLEQYNGEMRSKGKVAAPIGEHKVKQASPPSSDQGKTDFHSAPQKVNQRPVMTSNRTQQVKNSNQVPPSSNPNANTQKDSKPDPVKVKRDVPIQQNKAKTQTPDSDSDSLENLHIDINSAPAKRQNDNGTFKPAKQKEEEKAELDDDDEEDEEAQAEEVKLFSLPRSQKGTTPRADAFVNMKPMESPRTGTEPLFRCSVPTRQQQPSAPIDLPAIVSRQNTEEHVKFSTLHNRPKTFSTAPTTTGTQRGNTEDSSESATSSNGHQSTCSNPTNSKPFHQQTDNKGCISDPSTRQERKSAFTRPPAKKVVIDVGTYEKYARDKNGNMISNGKSFPAVTSSSMDHTKLMTHTRRLVNLVYPTYGTNGSKTASSMKRHPGARNPRSGLPMTDKPGQAMTREKTIYGGQRLTGMVRNSLDNAFTTTKIKTDQEDDRIMELKLGERTKVENNKVALPLLSPPTPRRQQFL